MQFFRTPDRQTSTNSTSHMTIVKPFDWTYTTLHPGSTISPSSSSSAPEWTPAPLNHPGIPLALLARTDIPILFFEEIPLFEDELGDNGIADVTIRVVRFPLSSASSLSPPDAHSRTKRTASQLNILLRTRPLRPSNRPRPLPSLRCSTVSFLRIVRNSSRTKRSSILLRFRQIPFTSFSIPSSTSYLRSSSHTKFELSGSLNSFSRSLEFLQNPFENTIRRTSIL